MSLFLEHVPQKAKSKQKRNLGILEMATKEFEDSSDVRQLIETFTFEFVQSEVEWYCGCAYYLVIFLAFLSIFFSCVQQSDEEAADNPAETEMKDPRETEPSVITEDTAASPQSTPESEPGPQESLQEIQAPSNGCQPPGGSAEAVDATSKAHLFIFDSESQEVESCQVSSGDGLAPVRPNLQQAVKTISNISLTQDQLEVDKQRLTELMSETRQVSDTCTL